MANYLVFFRDLHGDTKADEFIITQSVWFQNSLKEAAQQLATTGEVVGFLSAQMDDGDWSIWLEDEHSNRHNFILFVSKFERPELITKSRTSPIGKPKELVFMNPHATQSSGDFDYQSLERFTEGMNSVCKKYFNRVVHEILAGADSGDFTRKTNGTILIHINRFDIDVRLQIECVAKYVDAPRF